MPLIVPFTVDLGLYGQIFISLEFLRFLKSVKFRRQRLQRRNTYANYTANTKQHQQQPLEVSLYVVGRSVGHHWKLRHTIFLLLFSWSMLLLAGWPVSLWMMTRTMRTTDDAASYLRSLLLLLLLLSMTAMLFCYVVHCVLLFFCWCCCCHSLCCSYVRCCVLVAKDICHVICSNTL